MFSSEALTYYACTRLNGLDAYYLVLDKILRSWWMRDSSWRVDDVTQINASNAWSDPIRDEQQLESILSVACKASEMPNLETLQHIATPAMISVVQVFESFTIISNDNNIVWCLWYRWTKTTCFFIVWFRCYVSFVRWIQFSFKAIYLWQQFCFMGIVLFSGISFVEWQLFCCMTIALWESAVAHP